MIDSMIEAQAFSYSFSYDGAFLFSVETHSSTVACSFRSIIDSFS